MSDGDTLKTVRLFYVGVLVDAVRNHADDGVLEKVQAKKRGEQLASGARTAHALGISSPEQVFTRLSGLFDCVNWEIAGEPGDLRATATRCTLCALAKRAATPSPCRLTCLDPMEGMLRGLDPAAVMTVEETLFEGNACRVRVTSKGGAEHRE